jgi:hypothetical protein
VYERKFGCTRPVDPTVQRPLNFKAANETLPGGASSSAGPSTMSVGAPTVQRPLDFKAANETLPGGASSSAAEARLAQRTTSARRNSMDDSEGSMVDEFEEDLFASYDEEVAAHTIASQRSCEISYRCMDGWKFHTIQFGTHAEGQTIIAELSCIRPALQILQYKI